MRSGQAFSLLLIIIGLMLLWITITSNIANTLAALTSPSLLSLRSSPNASGHMSNMNSFNAPLSHAGSTPGASKHYVNGIQAHG